MVKNGSSSKPEKMVKNKSDLKCSPYRGRSTRRSVTRSKPAAGSSKESPANVKVVVRVRPPNSKELGDNSRTVVNVVDDNVIIFDPKENHEPFFYHRVQQKCRDLLKKENKNIPFTFDKVFGYEAKNADVFEDSTKSLISTLMDGYNCSVFVYGATGAGKTHTMLGHTDNPGITFLTMKRLFDQIEELKEERNFELGITYLEVYNETVKDLLNPGGPLHLREDGNYGVCVAGIRIHRIQQPNELFNLLEKGNVNRTQHPTDANAESSRSHAVFQVYVNMTTKTSGERRIAKLSMIDLAGSERGAATGCTGMRFTEGANINKSLLALGNCINSLADGHRHIPYRDSKLTRLLKDSLGGNCKTVMIANVSPSSLNYEDTYNTLKYATRAKKIKSNMKKNVVNRELSIPQYVKLVEELTRENELLKEKLEEKNEARTCSCKTESGGSKKKSPKSETEPAWLEKYRQLLREKRSIGKRIQQYLYKEDILQLKVKFKESFETHTKKLCSDDDQLDTHVNKILSSVNVFQRQVSGLLVQIDDLQKDKDKVNEEITALIGKENISKDNIDLLKSDLELQESLNEIATNHIKKLSELFQCEMEHRDKLVNKLVETINMYFHLLRGHGHITNEMSDEHRGLIRLAQGIRTVSWQDETETTNIKTEVSSELKKQNRTNLTELQKRLEVIEETYSTKLTRRKLYDDDTVASCLTSNDNEEISSESEAPANELNKTISLPQPTIDSDVINSTFHIVNKDPQPPVAKKTVLKESNTVTANNLFKAYKHSAKRIPLQSPGRLTKENTTKNSAKAFPIMGRTQRFPLRKNQDAVALKPGRGTKIVTSSIRTPKGSKR